MPLLLLLLQPRQEISMNRTHFVSLCYRCTEWIEHTQSLLNAIEIVVNTLSNGHVTTYLSPVFLCVRHILSILMVFAPSFFLPLSVCYYVCMCACVCVSVCLSICLSICLVTNKRYPISLILKWVLTILLIRFRLNQIYSIGCVRFMLYTILRSHAIWSTVNIHSRFRYNDPIQRLFLNSWNHGH